MGLSQVTLTTIEVEELGNTALEVGTVTGTVSGENGDSIEMTGKYIVIWKKNGEGQWHLQRDIWNFDA
jgi:ketosteroid isomerase-like protein